MDALAQDHPGVADDADVDRPVAADFLVRDIDVDDLQVRVPSRRHTETDDEVEARTEEQQDVALFPRLVARAEEGQLMVFGDHPAALRSREERNAGQTAEVLQLVPGL